MRINITFISILLLLVLFHTYRCEKVKNSEVIEIKSGNDDVVWIVQLSDLHFSVHYPQRAVEFRNFVTETLAVIKPSLVLITGDLTVWIVQLSDLHFSVHYPQRAVEFRNFVTETLAIIKPSLVLITGDLTDGKSKDHLIMKQNEEEWVEYQKTMENVITMSGLDKSIFNDLRGNHDNFGVPAVGGAFDYFSNYSINGQLGRSHSVNSVTLQTSNRNHLFVSLDSTMSTGLRGPTNLFGHPTDQLLSELNSHLSQWDSTSAKPLTKIAFGHFPLSFSAPSNSKRTLKEIFLKNSITAYLCGHLHLKFGKNLKRHHEVDNETYHSLFQLNMHQKGSSSSTNCSNGGQTVNEFWELEMGDWRKSRAMRVMAIDKGRVSFIDTDLKLGAKKMLILPTYPLDSRFMSTTAMNKYKCESMEDTSHIRALVFSSRLITSVKAKIYDSSHGHLDMVLEASMAKKENLYTVPWNSKAFMDSSPDRYFLQIEAIDINGDISLTELMPFSVNGFHSDLSWTWIEFFVLGIQWSELYYPILFSFYFFVFIALVLPKIIISVERRQYTYKYFKANKGVANGLTWVFAEVDKIPILWKMMLAYLLYLLLCPWVLGKVFTEGSDRGYMTYKGWVVNFDDIKNLEFIGFPDIMVVVVNHLYFVVLPTILIIGAVAAERSVYQDHVHSLSGKKRDDGVYNERSRSKSGNISKQLRKWARGILIVFSLAVCWKHFKNCRALMKAYEMNPLVHFPFYSFSAPFLLAYVFYKTRRP